MNNRWDRMDRYGWEPEENANECVWEGGGGVQEGWKYVLLLFFPAVIKMTCSGHTFLHSSPPVLLLLLLVQFFCHDPKATGGAHNHSITHLFHFSQYFFFGAHLLQLCCRLFFFFPREENILCQKPFEGVRGCEEKQQCPRYTMQIASCN